MHGQAPDGIRMHLEPPGMDFHPEGVWRRRAAQVRAERRSLLQAGDIQGLNRGSELVFRGPFAVAPYQMTSSALTGDFLVPVFPIGYSDTPVMFASEEFYNVLFSPTPPLNRPYTLRTYYQELSHNRVTLDGVVFAPFPYDQTAAYVTDGCKGVSVPGQTSCPRPIGQNRMGQMLLALLETISTGPGGDTVWAQFDNDGPDGIPNSGDDDGYVDLVAFLQPQVGGECSNSSGIWSHRWTINVFNNGSPYVTRTPRRDANGNAIPGQFLMVRDYTIQSQLGGSSGCASAAILPVGTIAHETGHAFGLPDLYDTSGLTWGVGDWSLMGTGNFTMPDSPSSFDPWSLFTLGWATVDLLAESREVITGPRQLTDTVFMARAVSAPAQYALIENRQAVLTDSAQMGPGAGPRRKMPGLLVWYVDEQRVIAGLLSNTVNTGLIHGVSLLQADGMNDLRARRNRGDMGDPFPGTSGNTRLGLQSNPAARDHAGLPLGFAIDEIVQLPEGVMRFRYTRRPASVVASTYPEAILRVNGAQFLRYEEIIPPGVTFSIAMDQQQLLLGGRTRVTFLSWNNGGAREQTVTSSAQRPDTLIANLAVEHRVLAGVNGAGTVVADRPGNLVQGIMIPAGTAVTLTAVPGTGQTFGGWTGDTVASTPTLLLPMGRPYDLTALFSGGVPVTVAEAAADLLGGPPMSQAQRDFLDLLGNRNGYFDVGDYLAMLARAGLAPGIAAPAPPVGETP